FHTQYQSRAHSPRNTQLSHTLLFPLYLITSISILSGNFPKNRPGQVPGTPAQQLSVQESPRPSSPQSITPNKALRAVLFSTGGLCDACHSTHARRSGLFFVLLSLLALSPSSRHASESEGNANPPRGHPFPHSNSPKALAL
uniref:Cytochrome c domain-containing protein n=1 Tax=Mesocestoides corti TaxID=53468 RepID=A0A5K3FDT3_MESCO